MDVQVKVDAGRVSVALTQFRLSLDQKTELMETIGAGQLVSIRRTFSDEGPGWPPLSPVSMRWKKYSAGHKLLIDRGRLINSINAQASGDQVTIGTNVKYAPVHQFGFSGSQSVAPYEYSRGVKSRNVFQKSKITNKVGREKTVTRKLSSGVGFVHVGGFTRKIKIPARPFLVFRPEDPARIAEQVKTFVVAKAHDAGLEIQ